VVSDLLCPYSGGEFTPWSPPGGLGLQGDAQHIALCVYMETAADGQ